ncbi:hypothetical protein H6P81_020957 [Aristolochia fimbriata]|uniref:Cytochrome P450 n=1 Tax=Aristolochia fimbriata TaxID=158543 RepID=A0AAV7DYY9_ARIFI|nr:hypothetical protein H6P81_020957 [Aristolochia fimbriata]
MDLFLSLQVAVSLIAVVVFFNLWRTKTIGSSNNGFKEAPEPAGRLPIIGHLHLLGAKVPLTRTFAAMADKHGPVFTVWLGIRRVIVVSGRDAARECFTVSDKALASRPRFAAAEHMGYNYAMFGFAPYGPYWREIRKIATLELLSNHRLELLKHVPATEVGSSLKTLYARWVENGGQRPIKVEMREWFGDLTFNNVVMMIAGKRYFGGGDDVGDEKEARDFRRCMLEMFYLTGVFVPSDAVPIVKWLDLQGHERAMKRVAAEMDVVVSRWVAEHRQRRRRSSDGNLPQTDFIDVMLSTLEDAKITTYDSDTIVKATSLALILGGTDTTAVTTTWTLALLLNNPRVVKNIQEEIDTQVGKKRNVDYGDISNLPYLQATIKEVMRLYPAAPLSVPHQAAEDCEVAGFRVPAGTRVMVNLWKIQRDPEVWDEPEEFRPERFLTTHKDLDVRGQQFKYIPFGSGRRSCPGISFAFQIMHLALARLLHGFDIESPTGLPVDMTEGLGITIPRANPLEVMLTPRLPSTLYN